MHPHINVTALYLPCPSSSPSLDFPDNWVQIALPLKHLKIHYCQPNNLFGGRVKLLSSSLCNFLQPPVTSSPVGVNILITLLSPPTKVFPLRVRDQAEHLCKKTATLYKSSGFHSGSCTAFSFLLGCDTVQQWESFPVFQRKRLTVVLHSQVSVPFCHSMQLTPGSHILYKASLIHCCHFYPEGGGGIFLENVTNRFLHSVITQKKNCER